ncbi:hypothetical protein H0H81_010699 [Sphagnurus paluster]|uniref:Superoxide dismutase copper/zinc binding domain-containing protein n=1 Tax=Sphagnurus paluster TaxID=117069 RepID=A0A9P7K8F1_9AGAR|nr:hypothetical protein H0H81_010699 [Sphagnurus paluster]
MDSYHDNKHVAKRQRSICETFLYTASAVCSVLAIVWLYTSSLRGGLPEILYPPRPPPGVEKAVALLTGPSNVTGAIIFTQFGGHGPVTVSGNVANLDPNALRGFHVHQAGDLTGGCLSTGAHYNPFGKTHGSPTDQNRHVGDLGNIKSNGSGVAVFSFTDYQLSLNGPFSILGAPMTWGKAEMKSLSRQAMQERVQRVV